MSCAAGRMACALALLFGVGQFGCQSKTCDLSAKAALTVTVELGGAPVCDATVTAVDGTFSQVLMPIGCTYAGAYERAGSYRIDVAFGGRHKTVEGLVVTPGECHVDGLVVTVSLDDSSDAGHDGAP